MVSRSLTETVTAAIVWQSEAPREIAGVYQIAGTDVKAENTFEQPNVIVPRQITGVQMDGNTLALRLPPCRSP